MNYGSLAEKRSSKKKLGSFQEVWLFLVLIPTGSLVWAIHGNTWLSCRDAIHGNTWHSCRDAIHGTLVESSRDTGLFSGDMHIYFIDSGVCWSWYLSVLSLGRCSVLQCVAVCCSVLQCVAVCCSVLQCVTMCCSVLQCVAVCCSVLQCVAVCCSVLQSAAFQDQWPQQGVAVCCSTLQYVAVCCSVLQCVVVSCRPGSRQ